MGLLDKAKELAKQAETSINSAASGVGAPRAAGPDALLAELGRWTYLERTGRDPRAGAEVAARVAQLGEWETRTGTAITAPETPPPAAPVAPAPASAAAPIPAAPAPDLPSAPGPATAAPSPPPPPDLPGPPGAAPPPPPAPPAPAATPPPPAAPPPSPAAPGPPPDLPGPPV